MRKKSLFATITLLVSVCIIVIMSCNKPTVDTNTTTATDNAMAEDEFMRLVPMVNSLSTTFRGKATNRVQAGPHYPTVVCTDTVTNPIFPRTMTINYGPGVTDSSDGKTRSGIIIVTYQTYWQSLNYQVSLTFQNYGCSGTGFVGTVYITHTGDSSFTEKVGGAIVKSGAYAMQYSCNRTFTWIKGRGDSVASHSIYTIIGSGSGQDRNAVNYTSTILTPLTVAGGGCGYIEAGTLQLVPAGIANRTINFGTGSCGSQKSVSIDGNSYSITIQ
jgi:hypothetical protein